jgi:uncharacterized delta-60 repeat protein
MRTPRNPKKHSRKLRIPKRRFTVEKLEPRDLLATGFSILDIAKIETNTTVWTSMASADLLKDGASDVVLGGWIEDSSYQVAMHQKGVGAITLKERTFVPTNSSLTGTGVGDANDDGIIDILLGNNWNSGSPNVLPLLGDGAGGFQRSTSRSNGGFFTPTYVSTFDFDGDGRNELVTSNYNDDSLSVISPNGNSTRIPLSPDYGANGGNHLIVDVNKDGAADLVSAVGDPEGTSTPGLAIAKGNGTGGFGSTEFLVQPGAWGQVYADYVDLNNDQAPEILVADSLQGAVRLYMNDGFGNFTSVSDLITEPNIKRIHVLNRPTATDSTICIATVSATDGVKLFFRNEGGNWEKSGDFPVAAKMSSVGDFDGDGTLDIVALDSRGTLTFAYLTRNRTPTISDSLRPDNSFGENNQIRVSGVWPRLHRLSGGRFAITSTGSSQEDSFGVTIDVFNANGKPDLTFGANGRTVINPRGEKSAARGLWELQDGSLLVVGDPNYGYGQDDWAVFKIKKSGTPDSSFGSGGIINLDVPGFGLIDSVAVDTFDRILITGKILNNSVLGVARLQSNGSIDPTFGTAGWRQVDLGNSLDNSVAYSKVLPGADGTFFVKTGREYQAAQPRQTILMKFDADGNVINDLRLGLGQEVRSDDAVIDSQGRILVVGTVNTDVFLVRYDSSGNLDASFGAKGLVNRKSVTFQSAGTGICLDGNNRIYVAYLSKDSQSVHIERFLSDGTSDREFGILGTFSIQFNEILGGDSQWLDLLRADDGGLLIGSPNSNWNSYVKRFLPDWDTLNLNEDSDSYTVSLTGISAGTGENQPLKITASSSNSLVISNVDVSYTSPDPVGSLKFKPATNSYGRSEIAVTVEDGGLDGLISTPNDNKSIRRSLAVNIISVNDPPVLPVFDDIIISEDSPEQTIEFDGVNAGPFESQPIHLNLRSINLGLIPAPHLSFQPSAGRGTIRFKPTANLNGQSIVNVDLTDGGDDNDLETTQDNLSFSRSFTITVLPVNDAPTDIYLIPYSVPENAAANSTIGTLSTTDPDEGNTFTYSLVAGTGDADNAAFNIDGNNLRANSSFDFETKSSYTVRVKSTDQDGLTTEKQFIITVENVNEAPTNISLSANTIAENAPENTVIGCLSTTDVDSGNTFTYSLVAGTGDADNAAFNIDGNNLRATSSFDFETKSSYTVRIKSTDQGGLTTEKQFTISVTDVPEGVTVNGTAGNDTIIATYLGDGVVHTWSIKINTAAAFNVTGNLVVDGLAGTDTLQIVGRAVDDAFSLDSTRVVLNTADVQFTRVENVKPIGGLGNDVMTVLAAGPAGVSASFDGSAGTDTVRTLAGANAWNLTGTGIGTLNTSFSYLAIESIQGGSGDDQFILGVNGKVTGTVLGGDGADTLNLSAKTLAHFINLQTNTATSTGGIGGIESFIGGNSASIIDVLIGANSATNWLINGANAGTLTSPATNSVSFSGFESLTGGTAVDAFTFTNSGSLSRTLTGGTATGVIDTLDLSAKTSALDFRLDATISSVPGTLGGYKGLEVLVGNNFTGTQVTRVNNTTTAWAVNGSGQVIVSLVTYSGVTGIVGGIGADTLTGPALTGTDVSQWTIDSAGGGTLALPSATLAFSGINNLTGSTGADAFEILRAGSVPGALNAGVGTGLNSISYAQWTTDVTVNLSVTTAANATAITGALTNIQMVTGGAGNDVLRGQAGKSTILVGRGGNDTLTSGSQRDLLFGGTGADTLSAGNGDDLLISGTTSFDTNREALFRSYAEWISTRTFAQRTANIWGNGTGTRANGETFLNSSASDAITDTVFADSDVDTLTGGLNQDWFFASVNDLTDFTGMGPTPDRLDS